MKIIEEFIASKSVDGKNCEDGIYHNEYFIVLIDGATSKSNKFWNDKKSGEIAKEVIIHEFKSFDPDCDRLMIMNSLNNALLREMISLNISKDNCVDWLRASVIVYSKHYKEIWKYGDCQFMINDKLFTEVKEVDREIINIRSFVNQLFDAEPIINDKGREFIFPLLIQQLKFENKNSKFGYPVLNGYNKIMLPIECEKVNVGDEIIFASDGYPNLKKTLIESESELNRLLEIDPGCYILNKQTKGLTNNNVSYDDRSYIRFIVT